MEQQIEIQPKEEILQLEVSSEDDARKSAATHWDIPESEVQLKIIEEEKTLFGLLGRKLRIEARPLYAEPFRILRRILKKQLEAMDLQLDISILSDGSINLNGPDASLLIGHHGEGLKALDYLVNLMARNDSPVPRIRIDCEGFRHQRERDLERIALSFAKDAMRTHRTVYLEPMSSWERRIIHLTLKDSTNVETHSVGFEPNRKVAIRPISGGRRSSNDIDEHPFRSDRPVRSNHQQRGERPQRGEHPHRSEHHARGPRGDSLSHSTVHEKQRPEEHLDENQQ